MSVRAEAGVNEAGIHMPEIVGISPAIVHLRYLLTLAARTTVNVLLAGEPGTGKEVVARAIHRSSARAAAPFIACNCALTAPDQFDIALFGSRRGAPTGPERDRPGLLREADAGVLFLDEIECLTPANQAKLLRVLDDGEPRPVGSTPSPGISVRFLAATSRTTSSLLARGELREDLYYRLRGLEIQLPPLRDRPEDIPLLAEYLLRHDGRTLSPGAGLVLARQRWPGNIRQLRSVLHLASMVTAGSEIDVASLNPAAFDTRADDGVGVPGDQARDHGRLGFEEGARQLILQALAAHQGNQGRAAETLGIHRSTLRRKMRRLGLAARR